MSEIERTNFIIDKFENGNAAAFARRIGAGESSISKLRSGIFSLHAFAERIALAYPTLNCRWMLTGEGEPFTPEPEHGHIEERLTAIEKRLDAIAETVGSKNVR